MSTFAGSTKTVNSTLYKNPLLTIAETADGSKTIFNPEVGEHYHSKHGALQESKHVFLQSGLIHYLNLTGKQAAHILEVGFGTGLNFLLTADYCEQENINLVYTGIEAFPLTEDLIFQTGYNAALSSELWDAFKSGYRASIDEYHPIGNSQLHIAHSALANFTSTEAFDVVYFDAFAAIHQPEMWSTEALEICTRNLKQGGVFVTYAITGNLKRSMKSLGFRIEKAPGAPGKREMLRAIKL